MAGHAARHFQILINTVMQLNQNTYKQSFWVMICVMTVIGVYCIENGIQSPLWLIYTGFFASIIYLMYRDKQREKMSLDNWVDEQKVREHLIELMGIGFALVIHIISLQENNLPYTFYVALLALSILLVFAIAKFTVYMRKTQIIPYIKAPIEVQKKLKYKLVSKMMLLSVAFCVFIIGPIAVIAVYILVLTYNS